MGTTEILSSARRLANHIQGLDGFDPHCPIPTRHRHLGATISDAILQAGLNYRTVVLPRVERLKTKWPNSRVGSGLLRDLHEFGPYRMLNWKHSEKPRRFVELTNYLVLHGIQDECDLHSWLCTVQNRNAIRSLRGIGPKTVDYLMRLVGGSAIAIDRHVTNFVAVACPNCKGYEKTQRIVQFAADLLEIDRAALDHAIWHYMSKAA